jgi:hypothetical protein
MINKIIKAVSGAIIMTSLSGLSPAVLAQGYPHASDAQKMLADAGMLNKQLHRTVHAFKNHHMDVALFVRQDNAYVALFSSLEGLRHQELDPNLIAQIKEDGVYVGEEVMMRDYLCKRIVLKRSPHEDEIYFVGKNCHLQAPTKA